MVSQYFVRQPNGLLARFSARAGLIYAVDLSEADAVDWYHRRMTDEEAPEKVRRALADEPVEGGEPALDRLGRWRTCLAAIRVAQGESAVAVLRTDHAGVFEPPGQAIPARGPTVATPLAPVLGVNRPDVPSPVA